MKLMDIIAGRKTAADQGPLTSVEIGELEQEVHAELSEALRSVDMLPGEPQQLVPYMTKAINAVSKRRSELSEEIADYIANHLTELVITFGPLHELMVDPEVTQVLVNDHDTVFVERAGEKIAWPHTFRDPGHLRYCVQRLVALNPGKRLDDLSPMVDVSLPDGSRINIVATPAAYQEPKITIRRYLRRYRSTDAFVQMGSLDERMATFLSAAVASKQTVVFSGRSGAGKTTLMEALALDIPDYERIITIEDTMELHLEQADVVRLLTRPPNVEGTGEITIRDLFINTLRMRADRVLLGEIRGAEALDFLQAVNSGHGGSLAVIHAGSSREVIVRLENLVPYAGLGIPPETVRRQMADGIDLIVQMQWYPDGSRKVTQITEVVGLEDEDIVLRDIFRFVDAQVGEDGSISGRYVATGYVPRAQKAFELAGLKVPRSIYTEG